MVGDDKNTDAPLREDEVTRGDKLDDRVEEGAGLKGGNHREHEDDDDEE
jgi:hypothetical protein